MYPLAFLPRSGGLLVEVSSFTSECRGPYHLGESLFVLGSGLADVRQVAQTGAYEVVAALSPDGRSLAYFADTDNGPASLYVVSLASGKTQVIATRGHVLWGKVDLLWSPDSRALVFSEPGKIRLYMRSNGRTRTLNTGRLPDSMNVGFSQNGDVVAYSGLPHSHVQLVSLRTGERRTVDLPRRPGVIRGMWAVLG